MTILAADLAKLRGPKHTSYPALFYWPQEIVGTADVANTTFAYPRGELTVTNTIGNWASQKEGQRYVIRDSSGDLINTGIVRKPLNGSTFYLTALSSGDTGIPTRIANPISTGDTITVYNDYPLWTLLSRIADQIFYKKFDVAYTDEGSNPAPVVRLGPWQYAFLGQGETEATFELTADVTTWGSKTVSSYSWTVPSTATATTGTTSATVGFTMPAGFGIVECTVTDSGGATRRALRPVWVAKRYGSSNRPDSYGTVFSVGSDNQGLAGRDFEVSFTKSTGTYLQESDIYPSMGMMLVEEALYNGTALAGDYQPDRAVGLVAEVNHTGERRKNTLDVSLNSPMSIFGKMPMVSQAIIEAASPANWTEVSTGLADPNLLIWYILEHHAPNYLTLFDYHPLPETPPRKRLYALNGTSITEQLNEIAALIAANIGCSSDGSLYFLRNPMIETNSFRNAMDEAATVTERDIEDAIRYPVNYRLPVGQMTVYGFALDSSDEPIPLGSIAPGWAQAQSPSRSSAENILITSQDDLNTRSGHLFAMENTPTPQIELKMFRNWDVFDPARHYNTWHRLSIPARFNPRGDALNLRSIITNVRREWSTTQNGGPIKRVYLTIKPETFGQPGETIPIDRGGAGNEDLSQYASGFAYEDAEKYVDANAAFGQLLIAYDDEQALARTTAPSAASAWAKIKYPSAGNINAIALNPYSDYISSGYSSGALDAWAVATDGTTCSILYTSDLRATTITWTEQASYTMNDSTCVTSAQIGADPENSETVVAIWRDQVGTYAVWTTDGSTWSASATKIDDDGSSDTANDDAPIGLAVNNGTFYTSGRDSSGDYRVYYTYTAVGTPTLVNNQTATEASISPISPIAFDNSTLYAGARQQGGWSYTYDLTETSASFVGFWNGFDGETWVDGTGFIEDIVSGSGYFRLGAYLQNTSFTPGVITKVSYVYDSVVSTNGYNSTRIYLLYNGSIVGEKVNNSTGGTGLGSVSDYTYEWTGSVTASEIRVQVEVDNEAFIGDLDGSLVIKSFYVEGTGENNLFGSGSGAGVLGGNILFKVSSPTGAAVWTDISPDDDQAPVYPKSIAFDPVYKGRFVVIAENFAQDTFNVYETLDGGDSYIDRGAEAYASEGLVVIGDVNLRWGNESLDYSESGINTGSEISWIGGWAASVGSIGRFLGIEAII